MDYINTGGTSNSVNFPHLTLPTLENAHRLIHIHDNVPGILAKINQVLADHGINIVGQYLKTNELIGYVQWSRQKSGGNSAVSSEFVIAGMIFHPSRVKS